jgi:ADP-ribose pyrophosphatase YjhB (NUDIX family)
MRIPAIFGRVVYFFGYPIFRLLIKNTYRVYVVVLYKDKILVTKNWLGFQKKLRLPGGGVHKNERPAAAACRELAEEVGIRITEKNLIQLTSTPIEARYGYLVDLFVLEPSRKPTIQIDKREILEASFATKQDLEKSDLSEELSIAIDLLRW